MRKRSNPLKEQPQHHYKVETVEEKKSSFRWNKSATVAVLLVSVFALTLFFNFYFNYTSGTGINPDGTTMQTTYLLSGPDPYYNMRVVRWTMQTGHYPWAVTDQLLEYPMNIARGGGSGARPPLMNMMAIAFHFPLSLFMSASDAIGFSMQFLPALFGALLVFPVYFLGKELFSWKAGLLAAMFIAIIPVHLASGHGSAFTLFDHDALILLLFAFIYLFYIRSIKSKSNLIGILYALLSGTFLGAMIMLWVEARYTYAVLAIFFVIQVVVNILLKKHDMRFIRNTIISWSTGVLIAFPMLFIGWNYVLRLDTSMVLIGVAVILGVFCLLIKRFNVPWVLSLPLLGAIAVGGAALIHFAPPTTFFAGFGDINKMLFGSGIYGSQTSLTIAEAKTFDMSRWIMSFGPTLYLIALVAGLPLVLYKWIKTKRYDYFFVFIWFVITTWLNSIAGRFINDYVPIVAILSGFVVFAIIDKINYKKMFKTMRDIGGLHGIRKGVRFYHILGVLFIAFVIMIPNVYVAMDAAIPANEKQQFGQSGSAFGLSTYKELYWTHALSWLAKQDENITDTAKRPGFISWWDYGFQEIAIGDHPTVADNYQRGIECAANFQTAASEKEAIAVLCVLLLRADSVKGSFSNETDSLLRTYLPDTNETKWNNDTKTNETIFHHPADELEKIILDPIGQAPSYNKDVGGFKVSGMNALYWDSVSILNATLNEEQTVQLYQELQKITGFSVRYYGTEGYDMDIFNVFTFLAQKGTFGYSSMDDKYYVLTYTDKNNASYTYDQVKNITQTEYTNNQPFTPHQATKDAFYQTMVVRAYRGTKDTYIPTYGLKHFEPDYISPFPYPGTSNPAVIISKYYPGGYINGTVSIGGISFPGIAVAFLDKDAIPHDIEYSNSGTYSLVSLAGNFSIRYYLGTHLLKDLKFNGTDAISEDEADRNVPYSREINTSIDFANVTGHVSNTNGSSHFTIGFQNTYYGLNEERVPVDKNGNYSINNLIPSEYTVTVYENTSIGIPIIQTETGIYFGPGEQAHNITITSGVLYGHVADSIGNRIVKYSKDSGLYEINFNQTTRFYETPPIDVGTYPLGIYADENATVPLYNLTMNVVPGAKEFDINAMP